MLVYSERIIVFIQDLRRYVKEILSKEVGLKVLQNRFLDRKQYSSYPISIVVYNNKAALGYFDPNFYELGFHESLMDSSKEVLKRVVRHEIAHYILFINYGSTIASHGFEFKEFCKSMNWDDEVAKATICLENNCFEEIFHSPVILNKIKKLLALSTSSNQYESERALLKAQELLLKHNMEACSLEEEEKVFVKRLFGQKKETSKMRTIAKILETFFVSVIYHKGKEAVYLEVLGELVNVDIADYVASVLDLELDRLWQKIKKEAKLKGQVAKNSFFLGIAKGYCQKVQALKSDYSQASSKALISLEKKLALAKELVYPRLSRTKSRSQFCQESSKLGELTGQFLDIRKGIFHPNEIKQIELKS